MSENFVRTFTGLGRIGIVEQVIGLLLEMEGNVGISRMAHLVGI